ncbi:MAG: ABC transporter substrate-binding protein [Caulobacteraceae bacterium]|nr:ABC transporter substrate-binding protein [Caulobacteraceae bacterium]
MLRRWPIPIAIAVLLAVVMGAFFLAPRSHEVVLHLGDQRGATRAILEAAGELKNMPYKIEWDVFPVGAPLIEAMKAGAVDFGYVGSSTMTFGLASGAPLKVINVWRIDGPGSGMLVAGNGPIRKVADLKGRRVAVVRGSPGHLLVIEALQQAGLTPRDVDLIFLSAGDAKAALASGAVDAWAIWDPYLAIGERQDGDRVLITSDQVAGEVECGVATDAAIALKRPELLDFIARFRRANLWAQAHPEQAAEVYARETGVPLDIARIVRGRMHVDVLPEVTDAAIAAHQHAADIYAQIGLVPRLDIAKVYDRSFAIVDR